MTDKCSETVWRDFARHPCTRRATVVDDGKNYCTQHSPEAVAAETMRQLVLYAADDYHYSVTSSAYGLFYALFAIANGGDDPRTMASDAVAHIIGKDKRK